MKVLVTARLLDPDKSSEGICTAKFLYGLASAGFQVLCLTSELVMPRETVVRHAEWLKLIRLFRVEELGKRNPGRTSVTKAATRHHPRPVAWIHRKLGALVSYATGFSPATWSDVRAWRSALNAIIKAERPDLVFVRGAGNCFEPHFAMLKVKTTVPWIANYHDPFPVSLYPEPYRHCTPLLSQIQEKWHKKIIRGATAVSFPSERLLRWVLRGDLERCQSKGLVISHMVGRLPVGCGTGDTKSISIAPERFTLLHAGTVLGPRAPWGLIEGFQRFVRQGGGRAETSDLLLVGGVHRRHKLDPRWSGLKPLGIKIVEERICYHQSLELTQRASVAVVLEAEAEESPFFPAKLTDCFLFGKPVLALSPMNSVSADILGPSYPYLVRPSDALRIAEAIERLWQLWRAGELSQAAPDETKLTRFGMDTVANACREAFRRVCASSDHTSAPIRSFANSFAP
jgi:hypothetical protein